MAQVYKAQLDDGRSVAVKVQRPQILEQVSKDLYVLRRAAEVYQRLIDRFAPQQKTNYVDLLNEWAVGFYTELDFRSEIDNLNSIRDVLVEGAHEDASTTVDGVYVPYALEELCTARVAVTEWIDGVKLYLRAARDQAPDARGPGGLSRPIARGGDISRGPAPGQLVSQGRRATRHLGLRARGSC